MAVGYRDLLAASGSKAGTNALDYGTPPITGAVSFAFTVAGTGLAGGALTGSATMTFGVSPTISGHLGFFSYPGYWPSGMGYPSPEALTTTVTINTSVVGGFTGNGPLASNITLTFGAEGRQPPGFHSMLSGYGLSIGVDAGQMYSTIGMAFGASWAGNDVFGYMNGAVTTSFTVSAVFEFRISVLQGRFRSPLMYPGYGPWHPATFKRTRGSLVARAEGVLLGTVPMTLSGFGSFAGSDGALVGAPTATFSVVGTLNDAGSLTSVVPLLFTPVGSLVGSDGALVGDVQMSLTPVGTITDPGAVAGAVPISVAVEGTLTGAGALVGDALLQFTVAGRFPNVWRPVNTGHGTIWTPIRTR